MGSRLIGRRWTEEYVRASVSRTYQATHLPSSLVLQRVAGKDASKQFWKYHNESILKKFKGDLQVGSLDTKKKATAPPTPPASPPPDAQEKTSAAKPQAESGTVAPVPGKNIKEIKESLDPYGDLIPYADPSWYQSVCVRVSSSYRARLTGPGNSTTLHTSTSPTQSSAPKSEPGSTPRSNRM